MYDFNYWRNYVFPQLTGDSIRCWDCNSNHDPRCADPFDNSTVHMKNCAYEPALPHFPKVKSTMCRKIRQKGIMFYSWFSKRIFWYNLPSNFSYFTVNGKWRYYRDCAYLGEPGIGGDERYCLMRTGSYNIFVEICTCVGRDGCNSATSLQVHTVILFLGSLLCAFHLR